jgi:hypothetical protein
MNTLHDLGVIQGAWEQRADLLRSVRPELAGLLADMLECEIKARIGYEDMQSLQRVLAGWLADLEDGELEDRIAVEVGVAAPWEAP